MDTLRIWLASATIILIVLLSAMAWADEVIVEPPADEVNTICAAEGILPQLAERIRSAAAQVNTLSSRFEQQKYLSMFAETLQSSGQFYYQRPDLLRWELLEPVVSGFVLQGDHGQRWHGRIKGSESFKLDQDPAMSLIAKQLFAWARADLDWLQQHYHIDMVSDQPIRLRLIPPAGQGGGFLDHLLIEFAESASYVAQVEIHEQDGDYTRIIFNQTQMNIPISDGLFVRRGAE
ncbi:MAG: outer membrane lipoprotein carrier protein LolA [Desulfuromonas sp.]|nr:outer membrane lipoprotein carrier protein LolA [Desulfuromonas sp.]